MRINNNSRAEIKRMYIGTLVSTYLNYDSIMKYTRMNKSYEVYVRFKFEKNAYNMYLQCKSHNSLLQKFSSQHLLQNAMSRFPKECTEHDWEANIIMFRTEMFKGWGIE